MTSYLRQEGLSVDEEAWARWELLDYSAVLAYPNGEANPEPCHQVVAMHQEFLAWVKDRLPHDRWLWAMYDGTQAVCWRLAGCGDVWLRIFEEIYPAAEPTSQNRYSRFIYLRTAAHAYLETGHPEQALKLAQEIHDLSLEDAAWNHNLKMVSESCSIKIHTYFKQGELEKSLAICKEFQEHLNTLERAVSEGDTSRLSQIAGAYNNIGGALFFADQYERSIPFMERGVTLGGGVNPEACQNEWTYLRLAAAVWATTQNRELTCDWLRKGAAVCQGDSLRLSAYPALAEVANDPEIIAASKAYRSQ